MADSQDPRVAVYLDFDNIVMSWYDRVHGRQAYSRDRHRIAEDPTEPEIAERLAREEYELSFAPRYDYTVVNDDLNEAYARLRLIIESERAKA